MHLSAAVNMLLSPETSFFAAVWVYLSFHSQQSERLTNDKLIHAASATVAAAEEAARHTLHLLSKQCCLAPCSRIYCCRQQYLPVSVAVSSNPRDAKCVSAVFSVERWLDVSLSVCLSVCLSVTRQYCV